MEDVRSLVQRRVACWLLLTMNARPDTVGSMIVLRISGKH